MNALRGAVEWIKKRRGVLAAAAACATIVYPPATSFIQSTLGVTEAVLVYHGLVEAEGNQ